MKKLSYSLLLLLTVNSLIAQNNTSLGTGTQSTFGTKLTTVGYYAGKSSGSQSEIGSSNNSFYGYYAGYHHTDVSSSNNTFIGNESGGSTSPSTKSIRNSTFVGYKSGYSAVTGTGQNVFLGANAGYSLTSGSGNIFIGYNAGYSETGSNKLYIDNSNTSTPLVYGDFNTNQIVINGTVGGPYALNVVGKINASALYVNDVAVSLGGGGVNPWTTNSTNINYNLGNVGIGILSNVPVYKLDVNGTINATELRVNGALLPWTQAGTTVHYMAGAVGIGTTTPTTYKLAVNGTIGSKEVKVENTSAAWPDYVFATDYTLPSLKEVEIFVKQNKHLPGVPSQQDIARDGHALGETDVVLLKKVEELTLYLIEQSKLLEEQAKQLKTLEKTIAELKATQRSN